MKINNEEKIVLRVANGENIRSVGMVQGAQFWMQGSTFVYAFFSLSLGGCDVVVGIQWL